jgi:signal peptidase I
VDGFFLLFGGRQKSMPVRSQEYTVNMDEKDNKDRLPEDSLSSDMQSSDMQSEGGKSRKKKAAEEKPFDLKAEILSWVEIIVVAAAIAFCLNTFIIANSRVPSASMENTIMTGDRVIGSRLTYKFFGDPKRGDVIIFKWPDNEKILFVKRIIGVPGDKITVKEGHVYLNDSAEPLEETYLKEPMDASRPEQTFTVPEGAYFCMGDNRNNSADARYWKNTFVYRDKILAKVEFKYFPGFKLIR